MRSATDNASHAIQLRHLRYFLAVADELHFGRAACRLQMAQPPLSQAIQKLETELGVQLFERTARGVLLTAPGRVFADEARAVLTSFTRAVAEARRAGGQGVPLQVGVVPYVTGSALQSFLDLLAERQPDLTVAVRHALSYEQLQRLRAGELDVGIFPEAGDEPDLVYEPLFPATPMDAYLHVTHPLAGRELLRPTDLYGEYLLMFPRALMPALYDWWLARVEEAGYRFRGVRITAGANPRDLMTAVAQGTGIALANDEFARVSDLGPNVTSVALDPPLSMPQKVIAWRADQPANMRPVIEALRGAARELRARVPA